MIKYRCIFGSFAFFVASLFIETSGASGQEVKSYSEDKQACVEGEATSCTQAGIKFAETFNYEQAAPLYQQGCDGGDGLGCAHLGLQYLMGLGGKRDLGKAFALNSQACDLKSAMGCFSLGYMYSSGVGTKKDSEAAVSLYTQACDEGLARSCSALGRMYKSGRGVKKNITKAAALYKQACDGGYFVACIELKNL